jgi:hypothetical protein
MQRCVRIGAPHSPPSTVRFGLAQVVRKQHLGRIRRLHKELLRRHDAETERNSLARLQVSTETLCAGSDRNGCIQCCKCNHTIRKPNW